MMSFLESVDLFLGTISKIIRKGRDAIKKIRLIAFLYLLLKLYFITSVGNKLEIFMASGSSMQHKTVLTVLNP